MIAAADLKCLAAGRWLLPLMAHAGVTGGSRFAAMLAALGLSRSVLAASLEQLIETGWMARNPGHGHPLRPEYVLTGAGRPIAAFARQVMAARETLGLAPENLSRWALPAVARLARTPARFTELRLALGGVSPRALSLTLKQLLAARLIERAQENDFAAAPVYSLSARGRRLAAALR